ncbi:MAG: hypothetical protein AAF721_17290 [Myxococcota bacterium]
MAIDIAEENSASQPGPVGRWLVLSLIVLGLSAIVGYAWLGHRDAGPAVSSDNVALPSATRAASQN